MARRGSTSRLLGLSRHYLDRKDTISGSSQARKAIVNARYTQSRFVRGRVPSRYGARTQTANRTPNHVPAEFIASPCPIAFHPMQLDDAGAKTVWRREKKCA